MWISPETTGSRPPPCAAFTFMRVDPCRVVVFGGRQIGGRVNELHILNMENWVSENVLLNPCASFTSVQPPRLPALEWCHYCEQSQ